MIKKSIIPLLLGFLFLEPTQFVFAANLDKSMTHVVTALENQASNSAGRQDAALQVVISRADTMISTRLGSLNTLSTRVQNDSRLTQDEKTSLANDIQTSITGLTTLKTKIDADTDVTTARADTKQIVTNYYVYQIFEPKMRLLIILNNMQTTVTKLQSLTIQLTTLVNTLNSQGKDTSALSPLIADITVQLQTISTTISADITKVQNISTTSNDKTTITQVKADITTIVKTDFAKIRTDMSQLRTGFKGIISKNATNAQVTPSITGTEAAIPTITSSPSANVSPAQ